MLFQYVEVKRAHTSLQQETLHVWTGGQFQRAPQQHRVVPISDCIAQRPQQRTHAQAYKVDISQSGKTSSTLSISFSASTMAILVFESSSGGRSAILRYNLSWNNRLTGNVTTTRNAQSKCPSMYRMMGCEALNRVLEGDKFLSRSGSLIFVLAKILSSPSLMT